MRVARLQPKKRRPTVMVLHFEEEEEPLELHVEVITRHGIFAGSELDAGKMEIILAEDEELRCREAAWRLLSHRPRTRAELERGLRQRRFLKSTVERVVKQLEEKGFLNDAEFARLFAREKAGRGDGPRLVEQQLRARGVDRESAQEAIRELRDPGQEEQKARALLEKWNGRSKPEDPQKRRLAAAQYLVRRGYDAEIVWGLVGEVLGGNGED